MELQQQTAQQQHQQITDSSLLSSKAPTAVVSTISSTPTSPFLGGPPIAAPTVSTSSWAVTYPQMQQFNKSIIQYSSNLPSSPIGAVNSQTNLTYPSNGVLKSGSTNPWSSSIGLIDGRNVSNANWQPSSPSSSPPALLPPVPDCLSDPFDLGRATAGVSNTSSGRGISNPFLIANGGGDDIRNPNALSVH
ncbi:unnamed protein product [Schistosoma margrebowiei]|uniref:Uncharacterized protein n=1 Tax=Schistosoma margrebowiei TaxID=48269 RepID=A0A183MWS5_9TREM|nr:unnamed protein product [Schistosoma margrebowiei]